MRATTAFNKMLAIPRDSVAQASFTSEGGVVGLRRRFRRLGCPFGFKARAAYEFLYP